MSLLEIVEDDPTARRLVLRAPAWTSMERGRRVLATVVAVTLALGWLVAWEQTLDDLLALALLCLGLGAFVAWIPREQVVEIAVDGASRSLSIATRGWWIWKRRVHRLAPHERVTVTSYGISPLGAAHPELGIEWVLDADGLGRSSRRTLPITGVVGLDRRDELEGLVHRVAELLGRKVRAVAEDLRWYSCVIGDRGEEPRRTNLAFGYRDAASPARLDVSVRRGFEPPRRAAPPLASVDGKELRSDFRYRDDRLTVTPERPSRRFWLTLALGSVAGAAIGGYLADEERRLVGVVTGGLAPVGVLMAAGLLVVLYRVALVWPLRALKWALGGRPAGLPWSPQLAWTSGFRFESDTLQRRAFGLAPQSVPRGTTGALFLVDRRRSRQRKGSGRTEHRSWRELWLFERGRWALLTRSRVFATPQVGACPTLDAIAFELGSRLDLPVRAALD